MEPVVFDFADDAPAPRAFALRPYQVECIDAVRQGWLEYGRQLFVLPGGMGKTLCFSAMAKEEVDAGGRVLIIVHTDELIEQARSKLLSSTGLESDKEKADEHASPYAKVVVASVQTLARINRLTGFSDDHFTLVIVDEAHRGLSNSHLRIKNYFHFGAQSLDEGWKMPEPGMPYEKKARVVGCTATNSRGDKRSLGEFYEHMAHEINLLDAVHGGWLVRPIVKNIPLKIDMRGVKVSRSPQGSDYDLQEVSQRMAPIIREIALQLSIHAAGLKTVVFTPSVDTARMLAEALSEKGMDASFVSGMCNDRDEKIEAFRRAGPGSIMCNALLVVEGFDVPDITGVCVLRPTKIWGFYVQACVRGTRTLPGVIDGLETAAERLAAIAESAKPCFYIIDFLWLTDRLDLVAPVDLVATKPQIREAMIASGDLDLVAAEAGAERDFLESLAKAAKKHANKAARTIDPLAWAVSLGDAKLATWEPESKWEEEPPTAGQLDFLEKNSISTSGIKYKGLASKVIGLVLARMKMKLATPRQLSLMKELGLNELTCATLTSTDATYLIDATIKLKKTL